MNSHFRRAEEWGRFRKRIAEYAQRTYVLKRNGLERLQRGDNPAHSLCLQVVDSIQRGFSKRALLSVFSSVPLIGEYLIDPNL
jgi:hypothetical protein